MPIIHRTTEKRLPFCTFAANRVSQISFVIQPSFHANHPRKGAAAFNALRDQVPTLVDILTTFPSCQPPLERLLDALPPHLPRYYSIANSPLKHAHEIHFAFNIVEYTTPYDVPRKGVATPWLDRLTGQIPARADHTTKPVRVPSPSGSVPVFRKPNANAFVLPTDTKRPLVLIGPGTGIAPFIGFLQHRQQQRKIREQMGGVGLNPLRDIRNEFGPIWVYYGFRDTQKDYLFEHELEELAQDKTITQLRLAVSRATDQKVYVQDLLRRDADALYDLIVKQDAAVYVCGDAKGMAKGVQDALVEMLARHEHLEPVAANKKLMEWTADRKYLRDLVSNTKFFIILFSHVQNSCSGHKYFTPLSMYIIRSVLLVTFLVCCVSSITLL